MAARSKTEAITRDVFYFETNALQNATRGDFHHSLHSTEIFMRRRCGVGSPAVALPFTSSIRKALLLVAILCAVPAAPRAASHEQSHVVLPKVVVSGLPFELKLASPAAVTIPYSLRISKDGRPVQTYSGVLPDTLSAVIVPGAGRWSAVLEAGGRTWQTHFRALPGVLTVLPPVLAIVMALIFRQVVIALFAGIWLGAFFVKDFQVLRSFYYVVDHYVIDSLTGASGPDHVSIAIFTLLLGGMVGVFSRIGGTQGVVEKISRIATTPKRGQVATWLMGIAIFFDDYTNSLIVGNTMRPITDRLKISREKLAYIVDSTAAPVACIGVITSWIGFEISLIKDAFDVVGLERNPFTTFVASIQYAYYPIMTLVFGLLVASTTRDFGPMLGAERRARTRGLLLAEKAVPLSNIDTEITFGGGQAARWYNAAIPVLVVVFGTFVGLIITGRAALIESGATEFGLMNTIRHSNSFVALLWSSLSGCLIAILLGVTQRLVSITEAINAWVAGVKSMMMAMVILLLAWCIGSVCGDLQTADYLVGKVSGLLSPSLLPVIIFITAAAISFSTGTSWGTMTILTPITIPLVVKVTEINAVSGGSFEAILLSSISSILAGSVFGDHCSPISDTTIMSSMASASDHIDHVRTQLPYAVTVAIIAMVFGYLPAGFNIPFALELVLCAAAVVGVIMIFGKREASYVTTDGK
jgi:Na+/H+ antiporter NhaC